MIMELEVTDTDKVSILRIDGSKNQVRAKKINSNFLCYTIFKPEPHLNRVIIQDSHHLICKPKPHLSKVTYPDSLHLICKLFSCKPEPHFNRVTIQDSHYLIAIRFVIWWFLASVHDDLKIPHAIYIRDKNMDQTSYGNNDF